MEPWNYLWFYLIHVPKSLSITHSGLCLLTNDTVGYMHLQNYNLIKNKHMCDNAYTIPSVREHDDTFMHIALTQIIKLPVSLLIPYIF